MCGSSTFGWRGTHPFFLVMWSGEYKYAVSLKTPTSVNVQLRATHPFIYIDNVRSFRVLTRSCRKVMRCFSARNPITFSKYESCNDPRGPTWDWLRRYRYVHILLWNTTTQAWKRWTNTVYLSPSLTCLAFCIPKCSSCIWVVLLALRSKIVCGASCAACSHSASFEDRWMYNAMQITRLTFVSSKTAN